MFNFYINYESLNVFKEEFYIILGGVWSQGWNGEDWKNNENERMKKAWKWKLCLIERIREVVHWERRKVKRGNISNYYYAFYTNEYYI